MVLNIHIHAEADNIICKEENRDLTWGLGDKHTTKTVQCTNAREAPIMQREYLGCCTYSEISDATVALVVPLQSVTHSQSNRIAIVYIELLIDVTLSFKLHPLNLKKFILNTLKWSVIDLNKTRRYHVAAEASLEIFTNSNRSVVNSFPATDYKVFTKVKNLSKIKFSLGKVNICLTPLRWRETRKTTHCTGHWTILTRSGLDQSIISTLF